MKNKFKIISLLLSLCLVFGLFSGFATVATAETVPSAETEPYTAPAIIDPEEATEKQYVGRVEEAETDLNTFVFQNADGTNTLRLFSHPVKYVAEDGNIRDISLDIQAKSGGGFVTKDHEIITTFAKRLEDGISLSHKDVNLRLVPALSGTNPAATLSRDGKTVSYIKDAKTAFVYQLTYTGFKEDIVVKQYTGQTEYEFTLYTGGLALVKENGSYFLTDSDGQVKATVGDIIVFTADEKNNTLGEMTHQTVEANQQYTLTIHLDGEYLADPATAYPIRIDPTVEIHYDGSTAGAIEDVTIQENATYNGTVGSLYVGRHEGGYLSRVLMRFPGLDLSDTNADNILSASVELRDLMCQSSENITVECYMYKNSAPAWSESTTTTWSSVGTDYIGEWLDSHLITYGGGNVEANRYSFNIINAVKEWAGTSESSQKRLVFKANSAFEDGSSQIWYKTFASYNRSAYRPSMTVTYNSFANARELTLDDGEVLDIYSSGEKVLYFFTPSSSGFYTFESYDRANGDPKVWFYNNNYEELANNDDGAGNLNFSLTYHLQQNCTYYFSAGCYGTGTGSYCVRISNATSISSLPSETIVWGEKENVACYKGQEVKLYRVTPNISGEHIFFSYDLTGDSRVWLYNSNLTLIAENDDSAGSSDFRLSATLTAGQTYYIVVGHFRYRQGEYHMKALKPANITSGVYYLYNRVHSAYVDIHGPTSQEWVHQWNFHGGTQSRWYIQKQTDGYYTIRSEYGDRKYMGISSEYTDEDNIKLFSSISSETKWKIFTGDSGELIFEPYLTNEAILFSPDGERDTELRLTSYSQHGNASLWKVFSHKYNHDVKNYYDVGHSVRFSNSADNIAEYQRICSEILLQLFEVSTTSSVYSYTSCADGCCGTTLDKTKTVCAHNPTHKSTGALRSDLISQFGEGDPTHSLVSWTGHMTGDGRSDSSGNTVVMALGAVVDKDGNNESEITIKAERIYTLLHELSHQLGAPDHYCYDLGSDNCNNPSNDCWRCDNNLSERPDCLMSERNLYLEASLNANALDNIYCSQCLSDTDAWGILTHLNAHHEN